MRGLFYKEIYTLRAQMRSWILVLGVMSVYAFFMKSTSFLYMLIIMNSMMTSLSAFSNDQVSHWESYALALPVDRSDMVKSRYLFALVCLAATAAACLILSAFLGLWIGDIGIPELLHSLYGVTVVGLMYLAIQLPVLYKLGVEKGRYVMMSTVIGVCLLLFLLSRALDGGAGQTLRAGVIWMEAHLILAEAAAGLLAVGGLLLSFVISLRIYEGKEF